MANLFVVVIFVTVLIAAALLPARCARREAVRLDEERMLLNYRRDIDAAGVSRSTGYRVAPEVMAWIRAHADDAATSSAR